MLLRALFKASRVSLSGKYAYDSNPTIHRALAVAIRDRREEEADTLVFAMQARNHLGAADLAQSHGEWWIGPSAGVLPTPPRAPSRGKASPRPAKGARKREQGRA